MLVELAIGDAYGAGFEYVDEAKVKESLFFVRNFSGRDPVLTLEGIQMPDGTAVDSDR